MNFTYKFTFKKGSKVKMKKNQGLKFEEIF